MQAFIKTVRSGTNAREVTIKTNITTQLSETVKEIQLSSIEEGSDHGEAQTNLCSIIEAIFLHGLKDSIAHRFRRVLADVDQRPEPSFWPPLLIISHRQIIDQISELKQVVSDIGQCRAWIRIALNDSLLSSYLMTIRQDPSALKPYYNTFAYLRDSEVLEVAQKLIEGVEAIKLLLPCNSSLLNSWPQPTLLLAGIWSPTLKSTPIASGVDVAQMLPATSSVNSETCSIASLVSYSSGIGQVPLDEDEALKLILAKHGKKDTKEKPIPIPKSETLENKEESLPEEKLENSIEEAVHTDNNIQASSLGNSLNRQSGWSFDENQTELEIEPGKVETKSMERSYNALVESSYNLFSGTQIRTPDFREIWQKLEPTAEKSEPVESERLDEIKISPPPRQQSVPLSAQVTIIAREKGLDHHDYECCGCKESFSLSSKPLVCAFTGEYFCNTCMSTELIPIPARIIHNWDFRKYHVSQKAFNCLEDIKDHPVIDFKIVNPYIYTAVEEMAKLQILRNQLNYLRAYLYTCREPIIEELQKRMWPREYMYEHIHQYSISDLLQIKDESLANQLEKVVEFGTNHVLNCWLCSQKGFLCEVCNQSKPLFPFDTENVYRCNLCSGVYHKSCLNELKPCPRCKRKQMRDDLPLDAPLD